MKIIWSNQAKISYEDAIDFILKQWDAEVAFDFENKTNLLLDKLITNVKLCPLSIHSQLRKCVIHKNTSLIYRVTNTTIELITFIDNRSKHKY